MSQEKKETFVGHIRTREYFIWSVYLGVAWLTAILSD